MMMDAQNYAEHYGYVEYWNGWRRPFNSAQETRKAFNSAIQGGCMQIFKRSILLLDDAGYSDHVNYVHDSVWINVADEQEAIKVQKIMEDWTEETFGLRFSTDRKLLAA
jgi:DNA polymerase I-like protein with 3'-5' exonuclease and polymerase domains